MTISCRSEKIKQTGNKQQSRTDTTEEENAGGDSLHQSVSVSAARQHLTVQPRVDASSPASGDASSRCCAAMDPRCE
ncbi:uncharacterized protein V6R79_017608 [Siganus canaliculatus]